MISVYTTQGCDRPAFSVSALASTVASRLSTAVVSVVASLWGKKRDAPREADAAGAAAAQPLASLPSAYGLQDPRRRVVSISRGPRGMCAATDTFGRVLLLDTATGTLVRVWKGYRDAQVAWLWAPGPDSARAPLLLLALHAPRRGLLELWSLRGGPRVAACTVPAGELLEGGAADGDAEAGRVLFLCRDGRVLDIVPPSRAQLK